jgi:hypothetical protein
MNWFLDMCILIFYAESEGKNHEKTINFVKNKKDDKFLLCSYIEDENMPKWIKRQKIIIELLRKKISDNSYDLGRDENFSYLFQRDIVKLKKLIALSASSKNKEEYYNRIKKSQDAMLRRLDYFMSNLIDKKVIPIKEIDLDLKSAILTFTNNNSDSLTIASGIQYNQVEELILLTGDKNDWTKENIKWVFGSEPLLAKKYPKIPEIQYIQRL